MTVNVKAEVFLPMLGWDAAIKAGVANMEGGGMSSEEFFWNDDLTAADGQKIAEIFNKFGEIRVSLSRTIFTGARW